MYTVGLPLVQKISHIGSCICYMRLTFLGRVIESAFKRRGKQMLPQGCDRCMPLSACQRAGVQDPQNPGCGQGMHALHAFGSLGKALASLPCVPLCLARPAVLCCKEATALHSRLYTGQPVDSGTDCCTSRAKHSANPANPVTPERRSATGEAKPPQLPRLGGSH